MKLFLLKFLNTKLKICILTYVGSIRFIVLWSFIQYADKEKEPSR